MVIGRYRSAAKSTSNRSARSSQVNFVPILTKLAACLVTNSRYFVLSCSVHFRRTSQAGMVAPPKQKADATVTITLNRIYCDDVGNVARFFQVFTKKVPSDVVKDAGCRAGDLSAENFVRWD